MSGEAQGLAAAGFVAGELVHAGSMSRLYRVEAPAAGGAATWLMKVPRTGVGEGGAGLLGFETELRVLGALGGPHVPRIVASGDLERDPYIVMECIEGTSVEALAREAPLPAEKAARIGAAIADALHSIHGQGAIHLDLKPENVILRASGQAVLIDFGMAHHAGFPDLLSEEGRFRAGSAPYIAPEQLLGDRSDLRSDIFALGVVLYELATGKLPFGSPRTLKGLHDRRWIDPLPPRAAVPALPPWFQEIALRCLEAEASRRYQSAAHVAFDLRHAAAVPLTARAAKLQRAGTLEHLRRWWRSRQARLRAGPPARAPDSPVVMVAVDTMHPADTRHPALLEATERLLSLTPEFRLICVSVVHGEPLGGAEDERGIHYEHLVRLRHWVQPLQLPESRLSLHVIESLSPSATLLEFARANNVDLIVIGAPDASQQTLAWWRSVASAVTANAPCTVHVVRLGPPR